MLECKFKPLVRKDVFVRRENLSISQEVRGAYLNVEISFADSGAGILRDLSSKISFTSRIMSKPKFYVSTASSFSFAVTTTPTDVDPKSSRTFS